ncbi:MAG TPA: D-alanine--D-alanine ligase family protein [Candidatus Saccharimonadales bacterium]|nr:D-alanine--D-alanine ligase family protein [Candidatus Saccharimonadales bacterium]
MSMKTVAVIFGGRSTEHDVSVVTAIASIIKPLELIREYRVEPVYIARDGAWYWDQRLKDIKLFTGGDIQDFLHREKPASVQFDGGMTLIKASGIAGRKQTRKIDLVFPAMHGTFGEDGALMGVLDMANVPYVGCGVAASAIAMDKVLSKDIAVANGIPTSKFVHFTRPELERDMAKIVKDVAKQLKFPLFVKPAHLGSSIGISRVQNEAELQNGLEVAAHYDEKVLVEEAVQNLIEVTLPIMGNDEPQPAMLERPLTKPEDFFDFDTKYMQGGKKGKGAKGAQGYSEVPAKLPKALYDKAEGVGLSVYKALGCTGTARIDMLIDSKTNDVYFNEVNPLPGGLYAHNWNRAGVSNVELVRKLIDYSMERWQHQQQLTTSFTTNYLKQF